MAVMRPVLKFMDEKLESIMIVLFYTYFLSIVVIEVTLRYGFNKSTIIGEETARHAFIWLSWIAASYCAKKRVHIKIAFLELRVSQRHQYYLNFFYNALFIIFCLISIKYVIPIIDSQYKYQTLSRASQYPMFLIYLSIPIGYGGMIIRVIQNIVQDFKDMKAGRPIRKGESLL